MADKEATVYIVDVGKSMGEKHGGRNETDLEWCMKYVWDKITTTMATGRKTLYQSVVALRSDKTENPLDSEEGYENISILQQLSPMYMPELRELREKIHPSKTNDGDAISALVVAIQLIADHCKKLKYKRRIILITNALGSIDADGLEDISKKIKSENIELIILGPDFDDADYGMKEEDKDPIKANNESILQQFAEDCDGVFGTMAQAIEELETPRVKSTKPVPSYKGLLTLGDPEKYDTAMTIDVERYPRTMQQRPPAASLFVVRADMAPGESQTQSSTTVTEGNGEGIPDQNDYAAVKQNISYHIVDPTAPGGKRDVDREDTAKGYPYGSTAVPISESERNVTDFESFACLDIIGFVPADKLERYMQMSRSNIIIAQKANEKASMALSSLIHALYEFESYAVARFVPKENKEPVILLLAPEIKPDYECLIDTELPFAEDMRGYRFPPLDRVVTVSGKEIDTHKNLPSENLIKAMSDYIDNMDLSNAGQNEDGDPAEYAPIEDTFSPVLHRVQQAIRWRAVYPTDEIPPPAEILTKHMQPPEHLLKQAQPFLDAIVAAGDVKRVPPRQKGRKRTREFEKPLSGLNVEELLGREKRVKLSAENAIPEFKQALNTTDSVEDIKNIANQFSVIIQDYIRHSMGESGYQRAVEAIRVMKEEMLELEEPGVYNDFMRELKKKIIAEELGGERKEMWYKIRVNKLGLIDNRATDLSDVTEEDAKKFLSAK
ncbi:ATP-dependent DNA helicase II subunit 2 [Lasiodiplodia hormozganensis]|uniref:ATP-dependent DNA helicase II subunit 2 n=1 Tax=Lasiodiplodia hormozganensis TaxID=869390 RepID=A0AA40CR67_9PEZI|nr:ATP-dependent DNA helicase II subunit 2 [Lasiodiplodia hormozganensis]